MRRLLGMVAAVGLAGAACTGGGDGTAAPLPERRLDELVLTRALTRLEGCEQFLDHVREQGLDQVTAYGLGGGYGGDWDNDGRTVSEAESESSSDAVSAAPSTTAAGASGRGSTSFSGTNVQVEGVDEPDLVKTDGERLVTVVGTEVREVDLTGDEPRLVATIDLGQEVWSSTLLVDGDRAVVFSSADSSIGSAADDLRLPDDAYAVVTVVTVVDLDSDEVVSTLTLEGSMVSARLVGGVARLVLSSSPSGLAFRFPEDGTRRSEREARERNEAVVRDSEAEDWLPSYVLDQGGATTSGTIADCDEVHVPEDASGLGTTTVLSIDPDAPTPRQAATVLADAGTVYASAERLYVATNRFDQVVAIDGGPASVEGQGQGQGQNDEDEVVTAIHGFDITDPAVARYTASGTVPGLLNGQFSLDEHEGHLRVATTVGGWSGPASGRVGVLAERDGALVEVASVGGLGDDEEVYGVRFMGDLAYVVTFRQTDPLHVLDLSDPSAPRERGELEIPGFSSYLHPIGDGLLLGVGQAGTDDGELLGTSLSVFDVSDPDAPTRLAEATVGDGWSEAEYDHHAFLHWPATGLTVLPITSYGTYDEQTGRYGDDGFVGAIGYRVSREGIAEVGRVTHTDQPGVCASNPEYPEECLYEAGVLRSLVVGNRLYTVSAAGVLGSDLETLDVEAWLGW